MEDLGFELVEECATCDMFARVGHDSIIKLEDGMSDGIRGRNCEVNRAGYVC